MKARMMSLGLGVLALIFFIAGGCKSNTSESGGEEVKWSAVGYGNCSETGIDEQKTFCVHEVTSVRRHNGDCNKEQVGDTICLNCPKGECPQTTRFYEDDGFILRACIVETRVINSSCKDMWPRGTCKNYITLVKISD